MRELRPAGFATNADHLAKLLGPFRNARSDVPEHRAEIARTVQAKMLLVADEDGAVIGVLRGRPGRLQSLFVRGDRHRRGVGRMLVERFEAECRTLGVSGITLAASLYAVPFYYALGYRRSTGVRNGWSFEGAGMKTQPMKKVLKPALREVLKPAQPAAC